MKPAADLDERLRAIRESPTYRRANALLVQDTLRLEQFEL